jgi:hypothetical protein
MGCCVGPTRVHEWVKRGWVKNITFLAETLSKLRLFGTSWSFHPIHFQKHMTGGSGVRGKADPIWVRKVFSCLRSL